MELVYLWVEDYKNIKKQGFNFSPRFECSYDEEKQELTIDENKEYTSIFPENINITAIVGENGSGKSNLFDLILDLDGWTKTNKELFFITLENKILKRHSLNITYKIMCNKKLQNSYINRIQNEGTALSHIDFNLSFLSLSPFLHNIDSIYSNNIDFQGIYNYKDNNENKIFDFDDFFISLIPKIPKILEHKLVNSFFKIRGKPNYIVFRINKYIDTLFADELSNILKKSVEKTTTEKTYLYHIDINANLTINSLFDLYRKIKKKKEVLNEEINKLKNIKKRKKIPNINNKENYNILNVSIDVKENMNIRNQENLEKEILEIGTVEFYFSDSKSSSIFNFSTGELVLLYYMKKLQDINKKKKDLILLIDECELFLHPEWQKKFINFLSELFMKNNYNRQIIIASHSPFILSDLPKENVIFLKDGELNCPFKDSEQTFGANIHTLLSHGFFMEDGLMGEFAKEKINEVIKYIKNEDSTIKSDKEAENIINIIGEPILKSTLQSMFDVKLNPSESKLDKLKRQQREIEEAIIQEEEKDKSNEKN